MLGTDPGRLHDPAEEAPRLGHLDPGAERAAAMGAHGDQAALPAGEVGGLREEREDLVGRAEDLRRVLEGGHRGRSFAPTRPGIVTVRAVAPVDVMLLGPPRVVRDGTAVAFDTRKALALLAVLALADRPRPRDVLAELLWPEHDAEHARGALRRTLSALRSAVGPDFVDATRDQVSLVRGPGLSVDVDRFRALAGDGDVAGAAALFRGEFLEGFGLRDAPEFEDWQRAEADALGRELATVLARLVEATGDVAVAQRWLELDPLHEPAHRALIRLYAERGDRAAALAQYRDCVRTLSRELGVPPLAETTRLYEAISEGTLEAPAATPSRRPTPATCGARRSSAARASGRRSSAPTTASTPTAAWCCWRARRGSARRAWPRSSSRTRAAAAPRCSAGAPTRRRPRSPTGRWSTRCGGGCATTTRGSPPSPTVRCARRRGCCPT